MFDARYTLWDATCIPYEKEFFFIYFCILFLFRVHVTLCTILFSRRFWINFVVILWKNSFWLKSLLFFICSVVRWMWWSVDNVKREKKENKKKTSNLVSLRIISQSNDTKVWKFWVYFLMDACSSFTSSNFCWVKNFFFFACRIILSKEKERNRNFLYYSTKQARLMQ